MRRKRTEPPVASPLVGQGFLPQQATKAIVQVVREIHDGNYGLERQEIEAVISEALRKARAERSGEGES